MENIGKVYLMSILLCIISSAAFSGEFEFLVVPFRKDGDIIFEHIAMGLLVYCWYRLYYCSAIITAEGLRTVNRLANTMTTFPDALLSYTK